MGTSKSYSSSIKGQPQWGQLSNAVTRTCGSATTAPRSLKNILSKYVHAMGGSGGSGRGKSKAGGRAGIKTAKRLGGFITSFSNSGGDIAVAFQEIGINVEGRTLNEVLNELVEHCTGPAATTDDVAAKAASEALLAELSKDAATVEAFGEKLKEILTKDNLENILVRYFGYYILERLSIMFYEKLVVEKGKSDCARLFKDIRSYVMERLKALNKTNPLTKIDWNSDKADRLVKNIQEDVLEIFE